MYKGCIFIGGAHGSGKSQLCKKIQEIIPCNYISASQLLHWNKKEKNVENVQENQNTLKELLLKNLHQDKLNIIDGHFVLWNNKYECEKVPSDFFEGLDIKCLILATEDSHVIYERLCARDKTNIPLIRIKEMSEMESEQATTIAELLKIPLYKAIATNESGVASLIQQILSL